MDFFFWYSIIFLMIYWVQGKISWFLMEMIFPHPFVRRNDISTAQGKNYLLRYELIIFHTKRCGNAQFSQSIFLSIIIVILWLKSYFIIDQQIVQHFMQYSECLSNPYANQMIFPFLNSMISGNHDKG